jgi:DNA helicase-2/ATP-dependent DNA helicase PcrA
VLAGQTGQVFVVGDDDQAIYGWRGARVENVQHFLRDFPAPARSGWNRTTARPARSSRRRTRSSRTIRNGSASSCGPPASRRADRAVRGLQRAGRSALRHRPHTRTCAARWQGQRSARSFIRSNAQSRNFEEQLIQHDIRYRVYGGLRFFDRAEIKDALAYLRLVANRHDDAAFERTVNTPPRGIGERTLDTLRQRARRDSASLWDAALASS